MKPSTRTELNKLRELVHFLLVGRVCHFCRKPLSKRAEEWARHGNATGPPFIDKLSIHHIDGNHFNDVHENKTLSHRKCHKSYHMKERHLARAAEVDLKDEDDGE